MGYFTSVSGQKWYSVITHLDFIINQIGPGEKINLVVGYKTFRKWGFYLSDLNQVKNNVYNAEVTTVFSEIENNYPIYSLVINTKNYWNFIILLPTEDGDIEDFNYHNKAIEKLEQEVIVKIDFNLGWIYLKKPSYHKLVNYKQVVKYLLGKYDHVVLKRDNTPVLEIKKTVKRISDKDIQNNEPNNVNDLEIDDNQTTSVVDNFKVDYLPFLIGPETIEDLDNYGFILEGEMVTFNYPFVKGLGKVTMDNVDQARKLIRKKISLVSGTIVSLTRHKDNYFPV